MRHSTLPWMARIPETKHQETSLHSCCISERTAAKPFLPDLDQELVTNRRDSVSNALDQNVPGNEIASCPTVRVAAGASWGFKPDQKLKCAFALVSRS